MPEDQSTERSTDPAVVGGNIPENPHDDADAAVNMEYEGGGQHPDPS